MLLFQNKYNSQQNHMASVETSLLERVKVSSYTLYQKLHAGEYRSLFQSGGVEYAESRPYTYGDDARHIDWVVSSRMNTIYSKSFHEDTNRTVWGILDSSGSMNIGAPHSLYEVGMEVLLVLFQLSIYQKNKVGGMTVADTVRGYVRPSASFRVIDACIKTMLESQYQESHANFEEAVLFTKNILKRKSLIIICSDFLSADIYTNILKISKLHDIMLVRTQYDYKTLLPRRGIIQAKDSESGKKQHVSLNRIIRNFDREKVYEEEQWKQFCNNYNFVNLTIKTNDIIVKEIISFFKTRKYSKK